MDWLFFYRLAEAVRDSLDRAGQAGYSVLRAESARSWFDGAALADFLRSRSAEAVPLLWEGRALGTLPGLEVSTSGYSRRAIPGGTGGAVWVAGDAALAPLVLLPADGLAEQVLLVAERRPGGLQALLDDYAGFARARARSSRWIQVVSGEWIPREAGLGWESLLGPASLREELRRQVETFFAAEALYRKLGIPHRRGLLLTGPPGNGKTTALRIVAARRPEPFHLFALTTDSAERELDEAFDRAAFDAPSILCFEDVDSLFGNELQLSHFLNRLDGLRPLDGVLVLATTNHPEKLDSALTERPSRFDRILYFGNPPAEERRSCLAAALGPAFEEGLVKETAGFSMAQLQEVRVAACLEAVQEGREAPTASGARRAVERLRGQHEALRAGEGEPGPVGFATARRRPV